MSKILTPPIKSQGIKTKLVGWIDTCVKDIHYERWVEPFMGTGVVAFNIRPKNALLCDSNPHIINFYKALQNNEITPNIVKLFLTDEGDKLLNSNGEYYYEVRKRFNETSDPLDFLFLTRACFNGMMRFNSKGGFNVPFCKKPNRFAKALVTKITNQVDNISDVIKYGDYTFENIDFRETLKQTNSKDLIYADPPYFGRSVDYFNSWSEIDEKDLYKSLNDSNAKYILSTWLSNKYRTNENVFDIWKECRISTKEHFYHIGGKEENRNSVFEALLTNFDNKDSISNMDMEERISNEENLLTSKQNFTTNVTQISMNL